MRHAILLTLLAGLLGRSSAWAGDWPQFRGPGGTAVAQESGLPVTWNVKDGSNVRWQAELPGRGASSPVVARGRVYVTACTGYRQDRMHVLAFDAATGRHLWERQFWATGSTNCHPKTCMAAPTPVTDGERVFALFATGDLACLDRDGRLLWYRSLVGDYPTITNQTGMAASAVLWKDVLVVPMQNAGDQSFVAGLDAHTGQNRWQARRIRESNWTTPLILPRGQGADVLFQWKEDLTAYDAETGVQRWVYQGQGLSAIPSPFLAGPAVLVPGNELTALRPGSAATTVEVLWKTSRIRTGFTTPVTYRERIYAVTGPFLNCVRAADGQPAQPPLRLNIRGGVGASPVIGDDKIYVVAEDGTVLVVQAGKEMKLLARNALEESAILATPALADGAIFFRADKRLFCIASKKGTSATEPLSRSQK